MSKEVVIDEELCEGHSNGRCAKIAPEAINTEGEYPKIVDSEELDDERIQELIRNCPSGAIRLVEK